MSGRITFEVYLSLVKKRGNVIGRSSFPPCLDLYKITNDRENHHGFQYVDGLNTDTIPFNPNGSCMPGGMYFFDRFQLLIWNLYCYEYSSNFIRRVGLCNSSKVWIENDKSKTDMFILKERKVWKKDPENYIDWNDEDECKIAVYVCNSAIKFVPEKNKTEEVCNLALGLSESRASTFPLHRSVITNTPVSFFTVDTCKKLIDLDCKNIKHMPSEVMTYELYEYAIERGAPLLYVPMSMRDRNMCYVYLSNEKCPKKFKTIPISLRDHDMFLKMIDSGLHPKRVPKNIISEEMYVKAISRGTIITSGEIDCELTEEMCIAFIKRTTGYHINLCYIPVEMRTKRVCDEAIKKAPYNLEYVPKDIMTRDMIIKATKIYKFNIKYVPEHLLDEELVLTIFKGAYGQAALCLNCIPERYYKLFKG